MTNGYSALLRAALIIVLAMGAPQNSAAGQETSFSLYLPTLSTYVVDLHGSVGLTWGGTTATRLEPTPNGKLLSAIDTFGHPHVMWGTLTSPRLIYHSWFGAEGWSLPAPVGQSLGSSDVLYGPYVDGAGALHLVWRADQGTGVQFRYHLYYSAWDGSAWSPAEDVYGSANSYVQAMSHGDGAGGVAITILDTPPFGAATAYQLTRSGGSWIKTGAIKPTFTGTSVVWPDESGGVRFVGAVTGKPDQVRVARWQGGAFVIPERISPFTLGTRDTQLDGNGNLLSFGVKSVPIVGGTGYAAIAQCLFDDGSVGDEISMATYDSAFVTFVKAADRSDLSAIAWKASSTTLAVSVFANCLSAEPFSATVSPASTLVLQSVAVSGRASRVCLLWRGTYDNRDLNATCAAIVR